MRHRLQQGVFDTVEEPQPFRRLLLGIEGIGQPQRAQDRFPPVGDRALQGGVDEPGPQQIPHPDEDLTDTRQLMAAGFPDTVAAVLTSQQLDPRLLTLEVTESVFVRDSKRALMVLNDLKDLGVTIALDDFGTGYCSLSYLNQFPVDIVKIDRRFIANLGLDPVNGIIVTAVVQLAHALQMTVIAEGIETLDQHRTVTALGCDAGQGFYFARPMPAGSVDTLLHAGAHTGLHLPPADIRASRPTGAITAPNE